MACKICYPHNIFGLSWWLSGKKIRPLSRRHGFNPWDRKIPWRRNIYPLQYSSLENATDRGAWKAAAHGVTESDTT